MVYIMVRFRVVCGARVVRPLGVHHESWDRTARIGSRQEAGLPSESAGSSAAVAAASPLIAGRR